MEPEKNEAIFVDGMIFKKPHQNAPDFVKGKISIKVHELTQFIDKHNKDGWVNIDLKKSKGGKYYLQLDNWEPKGNIESTPDLQDTNGERPF